MLLTIPPEIVDEIVDHLHNDKYSLAACSLTCKKLLPASRYHLFSELEIKKNLGTFLFALNAPWSSMGPAIRRLVLRNVFSIYTRQIISNDGRTFIPFHLANIASIRWVQVNWGTVPTSFREIFFGLNITHLEIDSFYFSRSSDLAYFISRLPPSIETLAMTGLLGGMHDSSDSAIMLPYRSSFLRITKLDVPTITRFKAFWNMWLSHDTHINLEAVYLSLYPVFQSRAHTIIDVTFVSEFLRHVGSSIKHLVIQMADSLLHSRSTMILLRTQNQS